MTSDKITKKRGKYKPRRADASKSGPKPRLSDETRHYVMLSPLDIETAKSLCPKGTISVGVRVALEMVRKMK